MHTIEIDGKLIKEIDLKKKRLIQYASQFELTNDAVVKCSQELDELLNQYQLHLAEPATAYCNSDEEEWKEGV